MNHFQHFNTLSISCCFELPNSNGVDVQPPRFVYEMDDAEPGRKRMSGSRGRVPKTGVNGVGAVECVKLGKTRGEKGKMSGLRRCYMVYCL